LQFAAHSGTDPVGAVEGDLAAGDGVDSRRDSLVYGQAVGQPVLGFGVAGAFPPAMLVEGGVLLRRPWFLFCGGACCSVAVSGADAVFFSPPDAANRFLDIG